LHLEGRRGRVARSGGLAIDLTIVQRQLESLPGVAGAVVSVEEHDQWGEQVVAAVTPAAEASMTPQSVLDMLRHRLDKRSLPRRIDIMAPFGLVPPEPNVPDDSSSDSNLP